MRKKWEKLVHGLACTCIRRTEHPLYFILPRREIPADSYSLERNKRWPSFSHGREEQLGEELPLGLLLHSARSSPRTSYRGLFFLREPLPARTLFFFLVPRLPPSAGRFFLSFFLSLSCCCCPGRGPPPRPPRGRGIMQRITEKSKQANHHEIRPDYHSRAPRAARLTSPIPRPPLYAR